MEYGKEFDRETCMEERGKLEQNKNCKISTIGPEACTPILANASNTVGLVDMHNPKDDFVGEFDILLLKQWVDMIAEEFGADGLVYLAIHKNKDLMTTARILTASTSHGDSLQVAVCGIDNDDVFKRGR